jgi:predicted transcriptional regulator
MKTLKNLKRELLDDAKTRAAYDDMAAEFAIARELIAARARAGLSQSEVAERMGTTQSVVARLESGKRPPSMRTVERFAQAVGGHLVMRIEQQAA